MPRACTVVPAVLFLAALAAGCATAGGDALPPPGERPASLHELVAVLRAEDVAVSLGDTIHQVFFSVPGRVLRVAGNEVQVFEYPNEGARIADSGQIDPDGNSVKGTRLSYVDEPVFFAHGRLIVLYPGSQRQTMVPLVRALGSPVAGSPEDLQD